MRIINRTAAKFDYQIYKIPASTLVKSGELDANHEVNWATDFQAPKEGDQNIVEVIRTPAGSLRIVEKIKVPIGTTVVFSTEIRAGIFS